MSLYWFYIRSSPFDAHVDKIILNDDGSGEDLKSMQEIYDKVEDSKENAFDCFRSIVRGLDNPKPHVVLKAINLLEFCVENCKRKFHWQITGGNFEDVFRTLLLKAVKKRQHEVANRLKSLLKRWAENEFKSDPEFSVIPAIYYRLQQEGVDFSNISENSPKDNSSTLQLTGPNAKTQNLLKVVEMIKATELSLRETNSSFGSANLHPPTVNVTGSGSSKSSCQNGSPQQKVLVKASLNDFKAAKDKELAFCTREIDQPESQAQADKCESTEILQQLIGPVTLNRDLFKDDESYNQYMIQFSMSKGSAVSIANDIVRLREKTTKLLYEKGASSDEKKHLTREKIYLILCFVIGFCLWIW